MLVSCMVMQRRVADIVANLSEQLKLRVKELFYSTAIDESTDYQNTVQLHLFIWLVNENFDMCKELSGIQFFTCHVTG